MRTLFLALVSVGLFFTSCTNEKPNAEKHTHAVSHTPEKADLTGKWLAKLKISNTEEIPFVFEINKDKICLINGEERVEGGHITQKNAHSIIELPSFNSYLDIEKTKEGLKGKWFVRNKEGYSVDFDATPYSGYRVFKKATPKVNFDGLWDIHLDDKSNTHVVGKFSQNKDHVAGTFLTNTGDYRFLEGQADADSMVISSFVGSHSFMIKAKVEGDSIFGEFFSSKHYRVNFKGVKTNEIKMGDPYTLTYQTEEFDSLIVNLKDIDGNDTPFNFSQYPNEVVLIQIMGSWCANCYDEALFFKELHKKYQKQGLRIIGLSYESARSKHQAMKSLNKFVKHNALPYEVRYAGPAGKGTTSEQWSMLNKISSYPTSILLNKKGQIAQIHTGFNGPSTGELYTEYVKEMTATVEKLLAE